MDSRSTRAWTATCSLLSLRAAVFLTLLPRRRLRGARDNVFDRAAQKGLVANSQPYIFVTSFNDITGASAYSNSATIRVR